MTTHMILGPHNNNPPSPPSIDDGDCPPLLPQWPCVPTTHGWQWAPTQAAGSPLSSQHKGTLDVRRTGGQQCKILLPPQRATSTHHQPKECRWAKLSPPSHSHDHKHNPGAMSPITKRCTMTDWLFIIIGVTQHKDGSMMMCDDVTRQWWCDNNTETGQWQRWFTLAGSDLTASRTRWKRMAAAGVVDRRDGLCHVAEAEPRVCKSPLLPTPYSDKWRWQMLLSFIDDNRPQPQGTRDKHEAKTTTMHHHGHDHGQQCTTIMQGPLQQTKHTTHCDHNAQQQQWTMITHNGHWWPQSDATNIYISSYFIVPFFHLFACTSCGSYTFLQV